MRLTILVLIGLPASGKTTLARRLKQVGKKKGYHFVHVCYDEIIPIGSVRFNRSTGDNEASWKEARTAVLVTVQDLLLSLTNNETEKCPVQLQEQISSLESDSVVVVIDDNMYYRSMRYALYQIARENQVGYCQLYFCCTVQKCLWLNSGRKSQEAVPPYIIQEMNSKLEQPKLYNKWEHFTLTIDPIDPLNEELETIFSLLELSLNQPEISIDINKKPSIKCPANLIHLTDNALRQIISCKIKQLISSGESGTKTKDYSILLSCKKSEFLNDLKSGRIKMPQEVEEMKTETNSVFTAWLEENFQVI